MKPKHIRCYIQQCLSLAECSDCPRAKFGCVIVEPITNTIRSTGYNNPSSGIEGQCGGNCCLREKLEVKSGTLCEVGCCHAEFNAVSLAARNGISLNKCIAFVNGEPCLMCSKILHHAGIIEINIIKGGYSSDIGPKFLVDRGIKVNYIGENGELEELYKVHENLTPKYIRVGYGIIKVNLEHFGDFE